MQNVTKMRINKPAGEVYEAFADPARIGNFWFSSSSERWESGKIITLIYKEYNAQVDIHVLEAQAGQRIVFRWGGEANTVTMTFREPEPGVTILEIVEAGFRDDDPELLAKLVDNKEGWVFVLTCLKGHLESGAVQLRTGLVKD
ncbi:SRPBCC domain-containing protein [Paenibacillus sp. R14(2021)]|uniref:SRPBCC domain-containing protein n=1 Tax=Paenibacillus sp. R14(2021) TaxID=2859228 RepID=UPI001C61336D|nr:SRPBCC domain-containing protein [Paenibacillus sp. R14(2021)]